MRSESLLINEPRAPVETTAELYAIAFEQAETAARRYGQFSSVERADSLKSGGIRCDKGQIPCASPRGTVVVNLP